MIYIKKLSKSDLTIFDRFWRDNLKQEAIVLGKNCINALGSEYLQLKRRRAIPVEMVFYGPEGKGPINRHHASIGRFTHDWRLQGCSLQDPPDDPERFAQLKEGDLFLFSFDPDDDDKTGYGVFISGTAAADSIPYQTLKVYSGQVTTPDTITEALSDSGVEPGHPLFHVINPGNADIGTISQLEDSLQAGIPGAMDIGPGLSREELDDWLEESERVGAEGEILLNTWLDGKPAINGKRVREHTWVSDSIANAPYDFEIRFEDGTEILLELKTTKGPFENRIYLSHAELKVMAEQPDRVILARLYNLEDGPEIRFAGDAGDKAVSILSFVNFPEQEIGLVSVWANPGYFQFNQEVTRIHL